jgi:serine/threonine protein kinase
MLIENLQMKFGKCYKKLICDCWMTITENLFFIINQGYRIEKKSMIGSGGFGAVYQSKMNNQNVAIKFVDITTSYKNLVKSAIKKKFTTKFFVDNLFGKTFHEALIQKTLNHPNILKCTEAWLQFHGLKTLELVIAMPLCKKNLLKYLEDRKHFKFENIRNFLLDITSALKYLRDHYIIHRDVKVGIGNKLI